MGSVFDIPYQELKQWGPGELVDHDKLNKPVDALNSLRRVGVNPPTQVIGTARPPTVAPVVAAASPFLELKFDAERDDYLRCRDNDDNVVNVAKPYLLRKSSFHDQRVDGIDYTYTDFNRRTASKFIGGHSVVETHEITPKYLFDQRIVAARVDGLNITILPGSSSEEDLIWLSIDDPRIYAEEPPA